MSSGETDEEKMNRVLGPKIQKLREYSHLYSDEEIEKQIADLKYKYMTEENKLRWPRVLGERVNVSGLVSAAAQHNGKSGEIIKYSRYSYEPRERVGVILDDGTEISVKLANLTKRDEIGSKHVRELEVGMEVHSIEDERLPISTIREFLADDMVKVVCGFGFGFGHDEDQESKFAMIVKKNTLEAVPLEPRLDVSTLLDRFGDETKDNGLAKLASRFIGDLNGIELMTRATTINLSGNHITSLVGVVFPPSLVSLNLSSNQITSLGELVLTGLKELNLSKNRLTDSVRFFKPFTRIMSSWAPTSAVDVQDVQGLPLPNVVGNVRRGLPDDVVDQIMSPFVTSFASLQSLETLNLCDNFFKILKGDKFPCSLKTLKLENNRIGLIDRIQILTNLTHLHLKRNPIASLDRVELPISLNVFELDTQNVSSLTDFQLPSRLIPSLAFTPYVLSKYDIEEEEPPGTTTKFVLKRIGAVAVGMSADPLAVVGNGNDSDSSTDSYHTAKSYEQGGGGNKSKTRRRQRRQTKRNNMQRKNKYSRRRRNAKSRSK